MRHQSITDWPHRPPSRSRYQLIREMTKKACPSPASGEPWADIAPSVTSKTLYVIKNMWAAWEKVLLKSITNIPWESWMNWQTFYVNIKTQTLYTVHLCNECLFLSRNRFHLPFFQFHNWSKYSIIENNWIHTYLNQRLWCVTRVVPVQ